MSRTKKFNLGSYKPGEIKTVLFEKPGIVELRCDVHAEMSAFIMVMKNPYWAVTDAKGRFEIPEIYMAFAAGLISFLSPCVLPLVPGYISFISGVSLEELKGANVGDSPLGIKKSFVILNSLFFITGFSLVFIFLGASATWLGALLSAKLSLLTKISGLVIIFLGLIKTGIIRTNFFYRNFTSLGLLLRNGNTISTHGDRNKQIF
jgi:cytochrome c biogenesis protein CcdA